MFADVRTLREPPMNVHKNARLTVFGRERLVKQVLERVLTPAAASAAAGVSLRTVYKLLAVQETGPNDRAVAPRAPALPRDRQARARLIEHRGALCAQAPTTPARSPQSQAPGATL